MQIASSVLITMLYHHIFTGVSMVSHQSDDAITGSDDLSANWRGEIGTIMRGRPPCHWVMTMTIKT